MRTIFFLFVIYIIFSSSAKAEEIPQHIVNKCREVVRKENPVKIIYNYGELKLDYSKNTEEVSKSCGDRAAGCFHGRGGCGYNYGNRSMQIGDYVCTFPYATVTCDFSGTYVDLTREYSGCSARAVLRHELQHFMIWKTAKEQMLKEMKISGTNFALQNIKVCKEYCNNSSGDELAEELRKIASKWKEIRNVNDEQLDKIDHNHDMEVNYTVCAPYSLKIISE